MFLYSTVEQLRYGSVTGQYYFFSTGIEKTPANEVTVTTLALSNHSRCDKSTWIMY